MIETVTAEVTTLVPGDRFYMDEPSARIQPRTVSEPHPDVIRPTRNGEPVRDTSGKIVKIVHERSWLESCETDFSMIHLHTDRGVLCVHREATVERKVD